MAAQGTWTIADHLRDHGNVLARDGTGREYLWIVERSYGVAVIGWNCREAGVDESALSVHEMLGPWICHIVTDGA